MKNTNRNRTVTNRNRTNAVASQELTPQQHVRQFRQMARQDKELTVTEYRKAYGIPDATFYDWRRRYAPTLIRK